MIANYGDWLTQSHGAAEAVHRAAPCYVAQPDLPDVVNEQISYLLGHADHNAEGCADCQRLAQVVRLLMRPFE